MFEVSDPGLLRGEIARLKRIVDEQEETIIQLKKALLPPEWYPPIELGLTPIESRIVACLYRVKGELVTRDSLYFTLYHDRDDRPDMKIIDVMVCKTRAKLKPYGVEIITHRTTGYSLTREGADIIRLWYEISDDALAA